MGGSALNRKTMLAAAIAGLGASADAALVAYFPLNEGTPGTSASTIDDIIDDASHGVTDGTANNSDATWVNDATRGTVLSTIQGNRFTAGTQDIDLAEGFTWAFWVKSDSVANADGGADTIIGSRNGIWNKVQPYGAQRYFDLSYVIPDDVWVHMAYTGDTSGGAMYINGVLAASDATPIGGTQTVNDVFEIGGSSRFSEDWTGLLSDIGIWNERLTPQRIADIAGGAPIPEPGSLALLAVGGLLAARRRRA